MALKTDSFVVEANVHFPTDYNLLYDCGRKCLDVLEHIHKANSTLGGWRKLKDWRRSLKNKMRSLGRASASGGKGKKERMVKAAHEYLVKAKALSVKLTRFNEVMPVETEKELLWLLQLEMYLGLLNKHIDLVERRIITHLPKNGLVVATNFILCFVL